MTSELTRFVSACSPFFEGLIKQHPGWLSDLQASGRLHNAVPPDETGLQSEIETKGLDAGLRRFRNREMVRIIWRDLSRTASLEQTLGDLSRLAELCLQAAVNTHQQELVSRFGTPRNTDGVDQSLVVIALGKLGGSELNLSSDIDLIFCYPEAGACDGRRALSNEQFFTRVVRAVIASLAERTEDGFCFRVDTRLRPFGESGPLTCSFGALEQYYQREGRNWERYALIKARPVAGDLLAGKDLLESLTPFVYRRYIDYGAVEALQEMLSGIRKDAARHHREGDIKRGPGGIREIEFTVQCLQLLRGGREPGLRTTSLLQALEEIDRLGLLPDGRVDQLREDYSYLRRLENAIQALHDQQTHKVPDGEDLERICKVMQQDSTAALQEAIRQIRSRITSCLLESFPDLPKPFEDGPSWRDQIGASSHLDLDVVSRFLKRLSRTVLSQRADDRLNQFMPLLLSQLDGRSLAPDVQRDLFTLVLGICRRSAYLSLLVQNPLALERMIHLFACSDWIADSVIRHPALLDELIDPSLGQQLPTREELSVGIQRSISRLGDPEVAMDALNHAKRAQSLRIAVAEMEQRLGGPEAAALLTELAEVLINSCHDVAQNSMAERHGTMPGPGLSVIGYGTCGACDMSYSSDLDLVFLYAAHGAETDGERPLGEEQYFTRLTRRMLALATTASGAGRLYEVDTRLRPNGRAGLLVSSLNAFERYQSQSAWTWELQALVRARPMTGCETIASRFNDIRLQILCRERDAQQTQADVREMRARMRDEGGLTDPYKHSPGGLTDIDFVAQLGVLICAAQYPEVAQNPATVEQLRALGNIAWLSPDEAETLMESHMALTRARHLRTLQRTTQAKLPDLAVGRSICAKWLD